MPMDNPARSNQYSPTPCARIPSRKDGSPPPIPLREVFKNMEYPPASPNRDHVHSRIDRSLPPIPLIEVSKNGDALDPDQNKEPFYLKLLDSTKDYTHEHSASDMGETVLR